MYYTLEHIDSQEISIKIRIFTLVTPPSCKLVKIFRRALTSFTLSQRCYEHPVKRNLSYPHHLDGPFLHIVYDHRWTYLDVFPGCTNNSLMCPLRSPGAGDGGRPTLSTRFARTQGSTNHQSVWLRPIEVEVRELISTYRGIALWVALAKASFFLDKG